MLRICLLLVGCSAVWGATGCSTTEDGTKSTAPFALWQLPAQTPTQMMAYVIQTEEGSLVVIDGGTEGDAPYLARFLMDRGGKVAAWFITHPHSDHCDALRLLLENPGELNIGRLYVCMPDAAWIGEFADEGERATYTRFQESLARSGREIVNVSVGQEIAIDSVQFRVLGVANPEIRSNPINNSCMVLRMTGGNVSVLFLADLGVEGGDKLLASPEAKNLPSEYVQMAHHGQQGVSEAFYRQVQPSYCLWPTPKWLWDNDSGGGVGSGPWKTLEVRAWMENLKIRKHFIMMDGLLRIR